jgi:hypothetical protein
VVKELLFIMQKVLRMVHPKESGLRRFTAQPNLPYAHLLVHGLYI